MFIYLFFVLFFEELMKKYLLLIEDEKLWEKFKSSIDKDINTSIIEIIKDKVSKGEKR
ncbi:MAG: hypothetical protein ACP5N7_05010 [Candidatus Pacearchaeota archaeon]